MAARLRGRILVLSLIALLFLPLAAQAEPSRVVPAEEILKKIEMGQPVEYDNVIIVGDLDVSALNLTKEPVQRTYYETFYLDLLDYEMIVASPISITNSRIEGSVNLNGTILQNVTSFQNTTFDLPAFILSSSFKRYADFRMVKFNKDADFEGAKFNKDADFGRVKFNKDVDFRYAQFNQTVDFRYAQFNHIAYFRNAQFNQTADFSYAQFNQTADFWQAQFNQTADFTCAQFNQTVDFSNAQFNQTAYFSNAQFNQTAYFSNARFNQTADFPNAQFNQTADFSNAQFNQTADFWQAQFNQEVHFEGAEFLDLSFNNGQFSKDVFFDDAQINGNLSLYRTKYDKLNIRWSSIHDLSYDDTAYYLLIENFKKQGFTDDASECYYSYRYKHMWELLSQGKVDSWFFDLLAWATNGYGLRPVRPLGWSVLFILLGGAFFFATKSISRSKGSEPSGNRRRAIRGKDSPQRVNEVSIWEALLLSATYFTSGASAIISSVPEEFSPLGRSRYVVVILRLLGWVFFVLFLTSLGKIA